MSKYSCTICGYVFDESEGVLWDNLPHDWVCPICGAGKSAFELLKDKYEDHHKHSAEFDDTLRPLKVEEYSALCSNLAKACKKQYLAEESEAFMTLSNYFEAEVKSNQGSIEAMLNDINEEIEETFKRSNEAVDTTGQRGSKRALVWSEKVTRMLNSVLTTYEKEGDAYLEDKKVYVCEICGFIYIGNEKPHVCPVCKVPNFKMNEIGRD